MAESLPATAEGLGSIPGSGRTPGRGNGSPLQNSWLENPMGRGALLGYSPWGREESDTTERLSTMHSRYSLLGSDEFSAFKNPRPGHEFGRGGLEFTESYRWH